MKTEKNHNDPSPDSYRENPGTEDEDLKREAPLLFGISKQEPFEAPADYFEKFAIDLSNKISEEKALPWYGFLFRKIIYIPSFIVLLVAGYFFLQPDPTTLNGVAKVPPTEYSLDGISFDLLNEYVENNLLANLTTTELVDMVGYNEIPDLGITAPEKIEKPTIEHIEEQEMEDYILDNIDDYNMYEIY